MVIFDNAKALSFGRVLMISGKTEFKLFPKALFKTV